MTGLRAKHVGQIFLWGEARAPGARGLFLFGVNMRWKLALLGFALTSTAAIAADSALHHVERTGGFILAAPVDKAFPLFEPVPEKQWAEGWEPRPVYPGNGMTVEGMVFTSKTHDSDAVWVVTRLDSARHEIRYVNVTPGVRVGTIEIHCTQAPGGTRVDVHYTPL